MKRFWRKNAFWVGVILAVQTILYIVAGANKAYFHMDEIYSYGLANYERVQLYETEDFYGNWHSPEYYNEYLTVGEEERGDWRAVYENQRDDVHPPLFYGLLRAGMELGAGKFSKWTGIGLNIAIAGVSTWILWMIIGKLTEKTKKNTVNVRAVVLTAMVALSVAAVSNVIYIRMYELLTLWILLTTWLHMKLGEAKAGRERKKLLVGIFVVELLGSLTQYYYWFYLAALFTVMSVRYVRGKKWKELRGYAMVVIGAGIVSLAVWPYALKHMFFSNRGGGVIERFAHPGMLLGDLWQYMGVVDKYAAHYLLMAAVIGMLVLGARALTRGAKLKWDERRRQEYSMVLAPVLFYLLIVTAVSPFIELRYVAPVCGLLVVLVAIGVEQAVRLTWNEKVGRRVIIGLIAAFVAMPVVAGVEPDTMYRERAGVMAWAKTKSGVPALYLTQGKGDWVFLNDLPIFRELGESYIAKGIESENETKAIAELKKILKGKDLSRGLVVVVNDDYDRERMVKLVERAAGLPEEEHAARVVTSDVYYLK